MHIKKKNNLQNPAETRNLDDGLRYKHTISARGGKKTKKKIKRKN